MEDSRGKLILTWLLFGSILVILFINGCHQAKPFVPPADPQINQAVTYTYEVAKGDSLWCIARSENIYGDSFLWPLLFEANRDTIQSPHWIAVGQVIKVPFDQTIPVMMKARKEAQDYEESVRSE